MINLLPPQRAQDIRYGRGNNSLRKWLLAAISAVVLMVLVTGGGILYMNRQAQTLNTNLANTKKELEQQNLSGVQKDAKEITGDIKVIDQILSHDVRFSELIDQIGQAMPPRSVLASLTLTKADGALDLTANATDNTAATQIAVNLHDPANNLFDKVDIINIDCRDTNNAAYPCKATFRVLFNKTAKTKFLSVPKESGGS